MVIGGKIEVYRADSRVEVGIELYTKNMIDNILIPSSIPVKVVIQPPRV